MNKLWFVRKKYGWGWTPVTWQGWLIMFFYLLGMVKLFLMFDINSHSSSDTLMGLFLPVVMWTSLLIYICYKKGEKPKWQWGIKNKSAIQRFYFLKNYSYWNS